MGRWIDKEEDGKIGKKRGRDGRRNSSMIKRSVSDIYVAPSVIVKYISCAVYKGSISGIQGDCTWGNHHIIQSRLSVPYIDPGQYRLVSEIRAHYIISNNRNPDC